jgi:hypothetical protein
MSRIGGKRHADVGPVTTSAVVRMPQGIHSWKGPRQTGPIVDFTVQVSAEHEQSLPIESNSSQTAPSQTGVTAHSTLDLPGKSEQALQIDSNSSSTSVLGLSAKRRTELESPGLNQ